MKTLSWISWIIDIVVIMFIVLGIVVIHDQDKEIKRLRKIKRYLDKHDNDMLYGYMQDEDDKWV